MTTKEKEKQTPAPAPAPKKTLDTVAAENLTEQEKNNLSRHMILGWYRAQRYEKLKALLEASGSEKTLMKEKVVNKTTQEIEQLNKNLSLDERKKMAEKFSNEFFNLDDPKKYEQGIAKLNREASDEEMFFSYLGNYGSIKGAENLKKLKNKKEIAAIFKQKPELEKKFDEAAETGDYAKVRELLAAESPFLKGLDNENVDIALMLLTEPEGSYSELLEKIPGVGELIKKAVDLVKGGQEILNYREFKKAAGKIGVNMINLMNLSHVTLFELQHRDEVFQKYKHLLVSMKDRTKDEKALKKIERDLKYIDDVNKIHNSVKNAMSDSTTYDLIRQGLRKRLDKEKKLTEQDKDKILAEFEGYTIASQGEEGAKNPKAKFMSLKVYTFLPLIVYGAKGVRENDSNWYWINNLAQRGKRFKRGVDYFGNKFSYDKAVGHAGTGRIFESEAREFKKQIKGVKGLTNFEAKILAFESSFKNYNFSSGADLKSADFIADMKHHDTMLRQYYALSSEMSHWLTEEGRAVVAAEKELKALDLTKNPANISKISDKTKTLLGITSVTTAAEVELKQMTKLKDVHYLREISQTKFAALSTEVCSKVIAPFEKNWLHNLKEADMMKAVKQGQEELRTLIKPSSKVAYYTKVLALPVIGIGIPLYDAARGKAKMRDVKWDIFDAGIGFVPVAGTINDFKIAFSGHTTSGRKITNRERVVAGAFGLMGAASDIAWAFGGLGAAMRGGIGAMRAGKAVAKAGQLGRRAGDVMEAEKVTGVQKAWSWLAKWKGERAIKNVEKTEGATAGTYKTLVEEERAVREALEAAKTAGNASEVAIQTKKLEDAGLKLAPYLGAESKMATAGERLTQHSLAINTVVKYGTYGAIGGLGVYALTGTNLLAQKSRDNAINAAVYGGGKVYDAGAYVLDKAATVQYGPPEFEDVVDQYVKERTEESNFNDLLMELEKSDHPDKKEKIEELCAGNWTNPNVQSWAYQNQDKLDLKTIMEKAKAKILSVGGAQAAAGAVPADAPSSLDVLKGDTSGGKKSVEGKAD